MKQLAALLLAAHATLSMAAPALDSDGVPKVDIRGTIMTTQDAKAIAAAKQWGTALPRKRMIAVDGQQVPLQQFMSTYCQGKFRNDTCVRGGKILRIDSTSGPVEKLPAGL